MTTKPKPRKAPAAKAAPKAAPKEAAAEPKREVSDSRWRWLAADVAYKAATAPTEKENDAAVQIHTNEQMTIETKLAGLVPENFGDVCDLLEFATQMADDRQQAGPSWVDAVDKVDEERGGAHFLEL